MNTPVQHHPNSDLIRLVPQGDKESYRVNWVSDTPWVTTGLSRTEGLTGAEGPADTRILDFENPMPSDALLSDNGSHWD